MDSLSQRLGVHGLPRVTPRELRRYRQFYQGYPRIWESVTPKSLAETDSILLRPEGPPKRRGEQRTNLETFFGKFKLFADLERGQDALALSGQDFASLSLCGSGFVAGYQQQHLPRLSTMRTKGGFLFSGPRILMAMGRVVQDEAFALRGLAHQNDCRRTLAPSLIPEMGFPADWKTRPLWKNLLCSHP